jgi:predicted RNA-binding Zn-ribbon protein involved in translation (DUF1610 family)
MKTLQKQVDIIWRFRCDKCRSKFEMTNEERIENNKKFSEKDENSALYPWNPNNYFDCPVCGVKSIVRRNEMHKYILFDDGNELQEY